MTSFTACLWETSGTRREELAATRAAVRDAHPSAGIVETCQRLEAFSLNECDCAAPKRHSGTDAVEHLAAVAAGLESAVLGEAQVLGQVRAGITPLRERAPWLDIPVAAARRLRAEAGFTASTGQMLDAALDIAATSPCESLLVLGAGTLARDVARRAAALGFETVVVASRREVHLGNNSRWMPLSDIAHGWSFDVVVGCLGPGAQELDSSDLPVGRVYIDLGSPPNFGPGVEPVVLLQEIARVLREGSSNRVERDVLRTKLNSWIAAAMADRAEDSDSPVGRMRKAAEAIRSREAERVARLHPDLSRATIDTITRSIANQLLHGPSERLREMDDLELARRFADLFSQPVESQ